MEVVFAFVAKKAEFNPDGSFSAVGADLPVLVARSFPSSAEELVFVAKLAFPPEECERDYQFLIELIDPSGRKVTDGVSGPLKPGPPQEGTAGTVVGVLGSLEGMPFEKPGLYKVLASLSGREIKSLPLHVVKSTRENGASLAKGSPA